jgi:prephenate dehydratase
LAALFVTLQQHHRICSTSTHDFASSTNPVSEETQTARVAIQGVAGSFSHSAALVLCSGGPAIQLVPCSSFEELFETVSRGSADQGVVPIENSLAGSVHRNYDLLGEHHLHIVGEALLRVRLCLIAAPGTELSAVRRVLSHPVALAQCRGFFASHPRLQALPSFDTATAVNDAVRSGRNDEAAIGSALAADLYGGIVLQDKLEDHEENFTRFLAVTRHAVKSTGDSKISLVFSLGNRPGSLYEALGEFARRGINLTKLESRPIIGRPWEYLFYLDCAIDGADDIRGAIAALRDMATSVRVLGTYQAAAFVAG